MRVSGGVATAFLVEERCAGGVDASAEKFPSLVERQSAELDPGQRLRPTRALECGGEALRRLARTERHGSEHGRRGRPAQQRVE
jgi:hypothetical protein